MCCHTVEDVKSSMKNGDMKRKRKALGNEVLLTSGSS